MRRFKQIAPYIGWSVIAATVMLCLGSLHGFASGLDHITQGIQLDSAPEASLVFDRHNNVVFSFASEDRTNVPLEQVSSEMISAVLAAEDQYFYTHGGMDVIGLARAAWVISKRRRSNRVAAPLLSSSSDRLP